MQTWTAGVFVLRIIPSRTINARSIKKKTQLAVEKKHTAAVEEQTAAMETDEHEGLVRSYLNMHLPENWDGMSIYDRRNYLGDSEFGAAKHEGNIKRRTVCNMEIWCECFCKDGATIKKSDSYEIAAIMNKIGGWERGGMKVVPLYGKQRLYVKQD